VSCSSFLDFFVARSLKLFIAMMVDEIPFVLQNQFECCVEIAKSGDVVLFCERLTSFSFSSVL
jgi:hypothetical protein